MLIYAEIILLFEEMIEFEAIVNNTNVTVAKQLQNNEIQRKSRKTVLTPLS